MGSLRRRKKGISLSINALVILSVSMIVLLAMLSFHFGVFEPSSDIITSQTDIDNCCRKFINRGGCEGEEPELECIEELNLEDPILTCCG